MDSNGDGLLSEAEVLPLISKVSPWRRQLLWIMEGIRLTPAECNRIFHFMDVDGSGRIDMVEFLRGADSLNGHARSRAKMAIRHFIEGEPAMALAESEVMEACSIGGDERCPLWRLPAGAPSLIFPGGETRCMLPGDNLYAFRVYPGDADKLYLDFECGGACFNEYTTLNQSLCKQQISAHPVAGIYNKSDARNPFRSHTIVMVVYCSGDLHVGSAARSYGGVQQRGYANAQAAIDWAKENMRPWLQSLIVGGCSAGSLGVQLWSRRVLSMFSFESAAVLADSYLDLFPGGSQQQVLRSLGACDTPLFTWRQKIECWKSNLTAHAVFEDAMRAFPTVTFAQVNSKYDKTQEYFHQAVAFSSGSAPTITNGSTYFAAVNSRLRDFNKHANYISFLVKGNQHCYTPYASLYATTSNGTAPAACGVGAAGSACRGSEFLRGRQPEPLIEWLGALMRPDLEKRSECFGEDERRADWLGNSSIEYCDAKQRDKRIPPQPYSVMLSLRTAAASAAEGVGLGARDWVAVLLAVIVAAGVLGALSLAAAAVLQKHGPPGEELTALRECCIAPPCVELVAVTGAAGRGAFVPEQDDSEDSDTSTDDSG
uniref:EF-hand domain-containing protein n=1 Tax=Zooxanthella nutricula TaxID=1333877 RepID=A0A7S2LK29_9DINO